MKVVCPLCGCTGEKHARSCPNTPGYGGDFEAELPRRVRYKFPETPNVRRNKNETEGVTPVTPSVRSETEVVRPETCPTCGRAMCPECREPIPVRGEYCKPSCRTKAWRKRHEDDKGQ